MPKELKTAKLSWPMEKDYRKLRAEAESLRAENTELKEALLHVSQVSQLQTNEIFGRGTEKLADILDTPLENAETDEEDRDPEKDGGPRGNLPVRWKTASFGRQCRERTSHKNRKAKRKRKVDFSGLPQKQLFRLDTDSLNKKYGEGNWRIAFWHRHTTLEEIPSSVYALNTYMPVISVGLEHSLVTIPMKLLSGSEASLPRLLQPEYCIRNIFFHFRFTGRSCSFQISVSVFQDRL